LGGRSPPDKEVSKFSFQSRSPYRWLPARTTLTDTEALWSLLKERVLRRLRRLLGAVYIIVRAILGKTRTPS